ncbi:MAG: secretin N-terminal domain-containing protein [Pseudomonadota bacterium]
MSALGLLGACIADPDFASESEREIWLDSIRAENAQLAHAKAVKARRAIKRLALHVGQGPSDLFLSVDLQDADLARVMAEILNVGHIRYSASDIRFSGTVSARFENRAIDQALNDILSGTGIAVTLDDDMLIFNRTVMPSESTDDEGLQIISREMALNHLQAADVVTLISDLYSNEDLDVSQQVTVSEVAELNAVYLSGPQTYVANALSIIAQADRPVPHVIITALIVDIDTSSIETLGVSLSDLSDGSFSLASIVPNTASGNIVATFEELAGNTAQLTATIKFLAAQNVAHVLSRPYVATRSTMPATIEIVDDQFARVDSSSDDASIITTDSITAGIAMNILPIVMADSSIRLDVTIEDSRFNATAGDIIIAKERNAATTSMVVDSGQTIVIGGLNSRYRITENSGLPWLRKVPILNFFTAEQDALEVQSELVIYLTPYVWTPGLDPPRALDVPFDVTPSALLSIERLDRN